MDVGIALASTGSVGISGKFDLDVVIHRKITNIVVLGLFGMTGMVSCGHDLQRFLKSSTGNVLGGVAILGRFKC